MATTKKRTAARITKPAKVAVTKPAAPALKKNGQPRAKPGPKPKVKIPVRGSNRTDPLIGLGLILPGTVTLEPHTAGIGEIGGEILMLQKSVDTLHETIGRLATQLMPVVPISAFESDELKLDAVPMQSSTSLGRDLEGMRFQVDAAVNRLSRQSEALGL